MFWLYTSNFTCILIQNKLSLQEDQYVLVKPVNSRATEQPKILAFTF